MASPPAASCASSDPRERDVDALALADQQSRVDRLSHQGVPERVRAGLGPHEHVRVRAPPRSESSSSCSGSAGDRDQRAVRQRPARRGQRPSAPPAPAPTASRRARGRSRAPASACRRPSRSARASSSSVRNGLPSERPTTSSTTSCTGVCAEDPGHLRRSARRGRIAAARAAPRGRPGRARRSSEPQRVAGPELVAPVGPDDDATGHAGPSGPAARAGRASTDRPSARPRARRRAAARTASVLEQPEQQREHPALAGLEAVEPVPRRSAVASRAPAAATPPPAHARPVARVPRRSIVRVKPRRASTIGLNGSGAPAERGAAAAQHPRILRSRARRVNSATSRDLPMPASPPTKTVGVRAAPRPLQRHIERLRLLDAVDEHGAGDPPHGASIAAYAEPAEA